MRWRAEVLDSPELVSTLGLSVVATPEKAVATSAPRQLGATPALTRKGLLHSQWRFIVNIKESSRATLVDSESHFIKLFLTKLKYFRTIISPKVGWCDLRQHPKTGNLKLVICFECFDSKSNSGVYDHPR